ncbi:agamous-like MADS-box AGL65 isoform X1 [Olea europaea subsp. europaea]|uniref:Agamous-like MADS-box AGL65 isoform X1 n=1 Tax=Olea europaea subsp. europaea TaxID=158383 RepID=A0A8S0QDG9_OLEEU|nr:agamous-like MADS-box AGL65 isoform X1 [Olea europaea subsp. europaea]
MGRVKLKIQRLESMTSRNGTYGKRRAGILKKAQEISVLCDIDIILLMFSPTGKPSIFRGQHSNLDEMIAKYAQLSPTERTKRRLESLETLKRNFKKLDQDVDIEEFMAASSPSIEEMLNQAKILQAQLTEVQKRLGFWTNPDKIEDIEHLCQMENSLRESLNRIHMQKLENLGNDQLMPLDCTSQAEYGMHFPMINGGDQDGQTQTWFPNVERQHMMLPDEPNFLSCRDMGCSIDTSLPSSSGLFGVKKEADLANSKLVDIGRQDTITINDYTNSSSHMRLPLGEQYSYHSYGNLNVPELMEPEREVNFQASTFDYQIKPEREVNFQASSMDYQINGNFELPRSIYNDFQHNLVSAPGPSVLSNLNDHSYQQQPLNRLNN